MKGDDIKERLLAWTRISADSSAKQPSSPRSWLLPRRPPAQLSRSELIAHSQFPVLCSPVGLDFRLTPMTLLPLLPAVCSYLELELLHPVPHLVTVEPEEPSGLGLVPVGELEGLTHEVLLERLEVQPLPRKLDG